MQILNSFRWFGRKREGGEVFGNVAQWIEDRGDAKAENAAFENKIWVRAKFAEDYSEQAKYNDYEYGRKATEALSEILDKDFEVLEIGAGPGTLTIPLAKKVKKVVAIESSEMAVEYLVMS